MMDKILLPFIVGIALSFITVLGDSAIKHASLLSSFSGWKWLLLGSLIYGVTGIGWFFVMKKVKLSTVGVLYAVSTVLFLTLISAFYFREKISDAEYVGIGLAITSLIILSRFA